MKLRIKLDHDHSNFHTSIHYAGICGYVLHLPRLLILTNDMRQAFRCESNNKIEKSSMLVPLNMSINRHAFDETLYSSNLFIFLKANRCIAIVQAEFFFLNLINKMRYSIRSIFFVCINFFFHFLLFDQEGKSFLVKS